MIQRTTDGRAGGDSVETPEERMAEREPTSQGIAPLSTAAAEQRQAGQENTSDDTLPGYRRAEQHGPPTERPVGLPVESIRRRLERVERQNRWMRLGFLLLLLLGGYAISDKLNLDQVVVRQTLLESKELKLLDNDGNARLFVRMYSRVPVLQVLDTSGKPRMSLGLRFDDTPFIDLSDAKGRTRATFEMTEEDAPAMRLIDEDGRTTFRIN
jgi:hypothetical protein